VIAHSHEIVKDALAYVAIVVIAISSFAVGVRHGTFAVADTDPYGYVSEGEAFARGTLRVDQRPLLNVPWPNAEATFSPLGWQPATVRGFIVPIYSPGLPVVMAVFQRAFGRQAVFYVVPVLAALAVLAIGRLGIVIHSRFVGLASALLLATSPTFLRHTLQPVSDVPTAAWWTLSLALVSTGGAVTAFSGGLAASMAILTRPNLVPLAAIVAVLALLPRRPRQENDRVGMARLLWFGAGVVPGCAGVAVINWLSNGSPLLSGYGSLDYLYKFANVGPNLDRYPRWLWQQESAFIYLALLSPVTAWWRRDDPHRTDANTVLTLLAFSVGVLLMYLPFSAFGREEWDYLRFLLPGISVLIVLSVSVAVDVAARVGARDAWAKPLLLVGVVVLGVQHTSLAHRTGTFAAAISEKRYVDVGRYIARAASPDAVFISGLHTGSIRYYSARTTIRYDQLAPEWLDRAIAYLRSQAHPPFIVLEPDEEAVFRDRFAASSVFGRLDWPPSVERFEPIHVRIYDPADRARYLAGDAIVTGDIGFIGRPQLHQKE
jgi:4-amino-4-deoxy-L-arabinose transferase-like glycosyltransferase